MIDFLLIFSVLLYISATILILTRMGESDFKIVRSIRQNYYLNTTNIENQTHSSHADLKIITNSINPREKSVIVYGVPLDSQKRTPLSMLHMSIDNLILDHFLEESMFSCEEIELNNFDGLENRVKVPIYIYEGYYHSLKTKDKIFSKNPNPKIGLDFMKPPASNFIRSFYEAFRIANQGFLDRLREELVADAKSRISSESESDVCLEFAKWIDEGRIFGDLSIQIHYGKGNEETFPNAWHTDAENSLLHLAVTVRGTRLLHSRRSAIDTGDTHIVMEPQHPGDVYLSSSTLMLHAPKFFNTTYDERVVAIHARVLYTSEEVAHFRSVRTSTGWSRLAWIIASNIVNNDIRVPNIHEINSIQREIAFLTKK